VTIHRAGASLDAPDPPSRRGGSPGVCDDFSESMLERLADVVEATPDFVGLSDPHSNAVYVNRAGRRMLGIPDNADVAGTSIADYSPPWACRIITEQGIPAAVRDGGWHGETALGTRDGREIPVSQVIVAHKDRDGRVSHLSTIARDLSRLRRAEARADEDRRILLQAVESMPDGFALYDPDERLRLCNARYRELFPKLTELRVPGVTFGELARAARKRGQIVATERGGDETFPEGRVAAWRRSEPVEYLTSEGRWIECRDARLADGSRVCVRVDQTERRRHQQEVRLLLDIKAAVAEAADVDAAIERTLSRICEMLGAGYGEAWVPNEARTALLCAPAWYGDRTHLEGFRAASAPRAFGPDEGVPGRVWARGEPVWLPDLQAPDGALFVRRSAARAHGLRSVLAVPVKDPEQRILAVLLFCLGRGHALDERRLRVVSAAAGESGIVFERKLAAQAVLRREQELELLLDSTAEGIYGIDADARCTLANAAAARMLGYASAEGMQGERMHEATHHTKADGTPYPREECPIYCGTLAGKPVHADDEVFWRPDGSCFPVEYWAYPVYRDGRVAGAVVTFLDVTERRRAREALEASERRLWAVVERNPDGMLVLDGDGRIELANQAAQQLLGRTPGELVGQVFGLASSGDANAALAAADTACYSAKEEGRNRINVFDENDAQLTRRRGEMQWVSRINRALDEDRFRLVYQPIVPVSAPRDQGQHYEILVRMLDDDGSVVMPGAFLPAAERFNLASRIDRWVVGRALTWLARHPEHVQSLSLCSINLSGQSLTDGEFLDFTLDTLQRTGVPAEKICFEVTETAAITNLARGTVFIERMRERGCRFALDDFGSGLSSFAYLRSLPVDYLKIDGSFVKGIVEDSIDLEMVRSINQIGHVMGKRTIAEFVDNERIMAKLREIGVDYAQGFGLGKPQPLE